VSRTISYTALTVLLLGIYSPSRCCTRCAAGCSGWWTAASTDVLRDTVARTTTVAVWLRPEQRRAAVVRDQLAAGNTSRLG